MATKKKHWGMPLADGIQREIMDLLEAQPRTIFTHREIADLIGANENSVSAQLSDLFHSGWVNKPGTGLFERYLDSPPVEDKSRVWYDPGERASRSSGNEVKIGEERLIKCQFFHNGIPVWVDEDNASIHFREIEIDIRVR
jgi:hypothetical protein